MAFTTAGTGLRLAPRQWRHRRLAGGAALGALLAVWVLAGCGSPTGSTPGTAATPGGAVVTDGADPSPGSRVDPALGRELGLDRVGDIDLEVVAYPVAEAIAADGGAEVGAMLDALGIDPSDVSLAVAVDPGGSLAISHWRLPGAGAGAILSAWADQVDGWSSGTLAGRPAVSGRGPDRGQGWATSADGVFLYIRTDDRALAEAAAATLRD